MGIEYERSRGRHKGFTISDTYVESAAIADYSSTETVENAVAKIQAEFGLFADDFFDESDSLESMSLKIKAAFPHFMKHPRHHLDVGTMISEQAMSCTNAALLFGEWCTRMGYTHTFVLDTPKGPNDYSQHCLVKVYEADGSYSVVHYKHLNGLVIAKDYEIPYASPEMDTEQFVTDRLAHYSLRKY